MLSIAPDSGEILALAEAPGFDPNGFRNLAYARTGSPAFQRALEPGSTMKVFLAAAGLDAGALRADTPLDASGGELEVPGKTIRDHRDYGVIDTRRMLQVSSNIGAVHIAHLLGAEAHDAALRRFGFGRSTASGFPSESAGLLRPWRAWKPLDHATIAFGQGVSVTAVQLGAALAALANDGLLQRPRLVAARREAGGRWQRTEPALVGQAVSATSARETLAMMESVVDSEGTARLAALRDVRVAGKTGTAQIFDAQAGRYSHDEYTAWFVGVAPADAPKLAVVVALDRPERPAHTGGAVAAPLFASVAAQQLARFDIHTVPAPLPPAKTLVAQTTPKAADDASDGPGPVAAAEAAPEVTTEPSARDARPLAHPAPEFEPQPEAPPQASGVARNADSTPAMREATDPTPPIVPDVASAPPAPSEPRAPRAADTVIFVPNLVGATRDEAERLARAETLELLASGGAGIAVSQTPPAGSVISGDARQVVVHFDDASARRAQRGWD